MKVLKPFLHLLFSLPSPPPSTYRLTLTNDSTYLSTDPELAKSIYLVPVLLKPGLDFC